MINPVDYMSRLKMPAMMTDTEGGVIFANAAAKRLLTLKCRRRLFSSLVGISGEKLAETCLRKRGAVVTTGAGAGGIRMLVLGGEDSLRWYFPQVLARASSVTSPDRCFDWIVNYAADAERDMLSEKSVSPQELFSEAAYSAHIGFKPPKKLNAYEFCRFLSLSTFFLIGSDRTEYDSDIGTGIILKSPEKAFSAAGEMIGYLFGSPGTVWQASATKRGFLITDGTVKLHAGGCEIPMILRSPSGPFTFSFATAITVASAVSAAEMAIFGGDETVKRQPKKLRENLGEDLGEDLDFVDTDD